MPRLDVDAPRTPAVLPQEVTAPSKPVAAGAAAPIDRGPAANEDRFELAPADAARPSLVDRLRGHKTAMAAVLAASLTAAVLAVSLGTQSPSAPGVPLEPATNVTVVKQDPPDVVTAPKPSEATTPTALEPAPRATETDSAVTPTPRPGLTDRTDLTPRATGPSTPLRPGNR